jgi:hypothetical protein
MKVHVAVGFAVWLGLHHRLHIVNSSFQGGDLSQLRYSLEGQNIAVKSVRNDLNQVMPQAMRTRTWSGVHARLSWLDGVGNSVAQ